MDDIYMHVALIIFVSADWKKANFFIEYQTSESVFNASYLYILFLKSISL